MNASIPSKTVLVLAAWVVFVPGASSGAEPGDKKPPHIAAVLLRDLDGSRDIPPAARPKEAQTRKPRATPGYDQLGSVLWSGVHSSAAALLANGADPNATSKEGEPILHYAVWLGHLDQLDDLLRAGADPNRADKQGNSPLHAAVSRGHPKTVALLLKYGADPSRKSASGTTALEDAKSRGRKDLVAALGAKPARPVAAKRIELPAILRRPDAVFGSAKFRVAGGGQALVYGGDGKQLITGDEGGALRFFDARTGELRNVINAHDGAVLGLARIPGSRVLISAGVDRTVRFWNGATAQELLRLRWGSKALAVSPDGRLLYTGYHLWQIESVEPRKLAPRGHEIKDPDPNVGSSWSFFTPDNRYLVIGRSSSGIWVWDLKKASLRKIDKLDLQTVKAITWQDLAAVCDIGTATPTDLLALPSDQYTILTGSPPVLEAFGKTVPSATRAVRALACSPNGQYLAALGHDSRIDVYDLENRGSKFKHDGHTAAVLAACASPDGKLIASGGNDQTVRIWSRKTGEQFAEIPTASFVYSVCFSPESNLLAIGDNDSNVYLWDVKGRSLQSYRAYGRSTDLAFAMRGELLIVLGDEIHVVDVKTRTTKAKIFAASAAQGCLAVSPQGLIVGTARSISADETFKVPEAWVITGNKLSQQKGWFSEAMGHGTFIDAVAFSPDGSLVAASSASAIRLWDMKKRQPLGGKMCGHTYSIGCLRFSPDGKWLASASWDGTARVWEVASGRQALVIDADVDRVSCVDFTPDGQLVTANWDGTVHQWDLPKHRATPSAK
ncbi:MAG: ankyrin repeat domain-containing protein [Gemmataceae bacterium]|nr:ankyrin repeat domain-containing protein [Gemmataceae bacterium]